MKLPKPKNINVERYIGGLSKFKKIENPIKLSANESALGPSPKAIKEYLKAKAKATGTAHIYLGLVLRKIGRWLTTQKSGTRLTLPATKKSGCTTS